MTLLWYLIQNLALPPSIPNTVQLEDKLTSKDLIVYNHFSRAYKAMLQIRVY